jgi:hypothetical protein
VAGGVRAAEGGDEGHERTLDERQPQQVDRVAVQDPRARLRRPEHGPADEGAQVAGEVHRRPNARWLMARWPDPRARDVERERDEEEARPTTGETPLIDA